MSASSSDEGESKKSKKSKKASKKSRRKSKRDERSRSSDSSDSSSSRRRKHKEKKARKKAKKDKRSAESPPNVAVISSQNGAKPAESSISERLRLLAEPMTGPQPEEAAEVVKPKGPMTKEQWEKHQKTLRRVHDPETGRTRLIRGDGEIMEEIVSRDMHFAINKAATKADGAYFETVLGLKKHK